MEGDIASVESVLARFRNAKVADELAFKQQLDAVIIGQTECDTTRTRGYVDLSVPIAIADLSSRVGFPIHGWYADTDGEAVLLLLFADNDNRLSLLEFYKADPTLSISVWPPHATLVRIAVLSHEAGLHYDFDPANGYSINCDL